MKKRVLFVIPTLRMGGAEKSLVSLLRLFNYDKYDVDLFLFESGGVLQKDIPKQVNIIEADTVSQAMLLEFRYYAKNLLSSGHVIEFMVRIKILLESRLLKKPLFHWNQVKHYVTTISNSYDVAVSYLEGYASFFTIDKVTAKRKVGWIHIDVDRYNFSEDDYNYYKQFDQLVTIANSCKNSFTKKFPSLENKMMVIENIIPVSDVKTRSKDQSSADLWDKKYCHILTVGRLEEQKGIDIAIDSCKLLVEHGFLIKWHVLGEGSLRHRLEVMIETNNLKDTFILEGLVSNPYSYMKRADLIVQSSRYEGKSIVLDEAKILGKPIVVTNYSSVNDQIVDGVNGIIARIDSVDLSKKIESVLSDNNLQVKIAYNASLDAQQPETIIESIEKIL